MFANYQQLRAALELRPPSKGLQKRSHVDEQRLRLQDFQKSRHGPFGSAWRSGSRMVVPILAFRLPLKILSECLDSKFR